MAAEPTAARSWRMLAILSLQRSHGYHMVGLGMIASGMLLLCSDSAPMTTSWWKSVALCCESLFYHSFLISSAGFWGARALPEICVLALWEQL